MEPREPCIFLQRCVFRMKNIAATASLFFQRYPSFQAHLDRNVCSSYPACHNRWQSRDAACCKRRCSATGWPLPLLLCGHWSNWKSIYSSSLVQPFSASFTGLSVGFPACDMPLKRILRGHLRQFSFQSISHREFHFYIQVRNAVKHIYYTRAEAENLERFLRICMSLRRQSMHMANGI